MTTTTCAFAIYARQSLDHEGAGLAVSRQVEDCVALARKLGYVGEPIIYSDNDMTAYRRRVRPGYRDLLDAIRAGKHEALIVWHNDRLHRRPLELEEFIELAESTGLMLHAVRAGFFDLSTPTGRMVARIVGAVAGQEVEHKRDRRARSNLQRARYGVRAGGTRGFGYGRTVLVDGVCHERDATRINRKEAAAIRDAAQRIIAGESTTTVWRSWNAAGLRTPKGKEWQASTFRRTMTRPALAGLMVYQGKVLPGVRTKAAPILTLQQLEAVRAVFAKPERYRCKPQPVRGLLDRVAICGTCGTPLRLRINTKRRRTDGTTSRFRTYCCPGTAAGHSGIVADIADQAVEEVVAEVLATMERDPRGASPADADTVALTMELKHLQQREQRLVEAVADGLLPRDMTRSTLALIEADRSRVTAALRGTSHSAHARTRDQVAERFLRQLPAATVQHWPVWFSAAHPDLAEGTLKHQLHEAFHAQPLPVQQAVIRASVKVVIWPHSANRKRVQITRI